MPVLGPVNRRKLIRFLKDLGFNGPFAGGKHEYMLKNTKRIIIPNPHSGDISKPLLVEILKEAGISKDEWEKL